MARVTDEYLPLSAIGTFPDDWQEKTLTQVCLQVTDGTHDSPKPVLSGGYPLVTGKAIKDRRIDFSVTYNISDEEHRKVIERSKPETEDILFANIGNSIGDLVRVLDARPFSIKNVALFKPNQTIIYPRYLEYYMLSELVQGFIKSSTRGSAQPFIGLGSLRGFPVALPPLGEQRSIGDLLGAIDDRITLLRDTNATLEAIAQAMFKSWFVDFDPVHAKQQGRAPEGMDEATAALFPNSFQQSVLGPIPEMWEAVTLGTFLTESPKRVGRTDAIVLSAVQSGELVKSSDHFNKKVHSDDIGKYKAVAKNSFAYNPSRINIGSIGMNEFDSLGAVSPVYVVAIPETTEHGYFLWHQLKMKNIQEKIKNLCSGTVRQSLSFKDFSSISIVIPPHQLLFEFSQIRKILYKQIVKNTEQIEVLTSIRDTLLPRLISGQLRLSDATESLTGT